MVSRIRATEEAGCQPALQLVARDGIPRLGSGRGGLPTRPTIVVDPVLVNHRGEAMFPPAVAAAYRALLFPLADLVTPNRAEAGLLRMWDEAQGGGEAGETRGGAG